MSTPSLDQEQEAFLPVYSTVPEEWEEGRQFLIEQLKKITNTVNIREIGWYLDEELLSGGQFIPAATNSQQYRSIYRKVIDMGAVIAGANSKAHGLTFDKNFTLMNLYVSATDSVGFTSNIYWSRG